MPHSNQIREFIITPNGIDLVEVYTGPEGVLTGSMRLAQEARELAVERAKHTETERRRRDLARKRTTLEAQIAVLNADMAALAEEAGALDEGEKKEQNAFAATRQALKSRRGDRTAAAGSETTVGKPKKSQSMSPNDRGIPSSTDARLTPLGICVCTSRADAKIHSRVRKPEAPLRGAPARTVLDRDHRSRRQSQAREGRSDSRHPDPRPQTP